MQSKKESREHAMDSRPEFAMVIQRLYSCVLGRRSVLYSIAKTADTAPRANPELGLCEERLHSLATRPEYQTYCGRREECLERPGILASHSLPTQTAVENTKSQYEALMALGKPGTISARAADRNTRCPLMVSWSTMLSEPSRNLHILPLINRSLCCPIKSVNITSD